MNELALFAGVAGGLLGSKFLGWRTVCAVEAGEYPTRILLQRQRDKCLPLFPIWDDVRTFHGTPWKGKVDIITGGFPCQPFSTAIHGRHNADTTLILWSDMFRIIREVEPRFIFGENVSRSIIVSAAADCTNLGYKAEVLSLSASDMGADHQRARHWFLAYSNEGHELLRSVNVQTRGVQEFNTSIWSKAPEGWKSDPVIADQRQGLQPRRKYGRAEKTGYRGSEVAISAGGAPSAQPRRNGMADGMAPRVDRYSAIGEGQVPAVSTTAFSVLAGKIISGG